MIRFLLCTAFLVPLPSDQEDPSKEVWFLELQEEDGSWDADRSPDGLKGFVPGRPRDDVAVTGLLALAFLGNNAPRTADRYSDSYHRAMSWLATQQTEGGCFGRHAHARSLYHHTLATLAFSEHVYFEGEPDYSAQAKQAVVFLEEATLAGGGWSASGKPEDPVDPSTTAWAAMALRSAREAKLIDGRESTDRAVAWFRKRCDPESGLFRASDVADVGPKATLCALVTRFFLDQERRGDADFLAALDAVIESRPEFRADPEYYYFTSVVAYQTGGKRWKVWNKLLKKSVLELVRNDAEATPGMAPVDFEAPVGGSLGGTAFWSLCLEIYFRYAKLIGAR